MAVKADVTANIPQVSSPPEVWEQWHKDLKAFFGKKTANSIWVKAWKLRGSTKSSTVELRKYLSDNGIKISTTSLQDVKDLGSGVTDMAGDIFKVGKYAGIAIGVIIIGGAGMIIYNLAKAPAQSVGTIIKYAK